MIISAGHPELGRGTGALVVRSGREIPRLRYASLGMTSRKITGLKPQR
jgi:hypothetical protein